MLRLLDMEAGITFSNGSFPDQVRDRNDHDDGGDGQGNDRLFSHEYGNQVDDDECRNEDDHDAPHEVVKP